MLHLKSPLTELNKIGKANYLLLKKLGLETIQDLLFYFPWRYDNFHNIKSLDKSKIGEKINIIGNVEVISNKRSWKRKMYITEALINTGEETIKTIWFNQPFLIKNIREGNKVSLAGKLSYQQKQYTLISPIYEKINSQQTIHTQGLIPIYHTTNKLTQKQLRFLIKQVLPVTKQLIDWIPEEIRKKLNLINLSEAVKKIHFPSSTQDIIQAKQRLGFAELFIRQLKSQIIKRDLKLKTAYSIKFLENKTKSFISSLPFSLTNSQKKTTWEILQDLEKPYPMNRLLEGDVGSGKTIVSIIAILNTILNKKRVVFMAPTEILAQQHFNDLIAILKSYKLNIQLLTKNNKPKDYQKAHIIIGTHALIQDNIEFNNVALVIIDEQHRFGVEQRKKLTMINKDNISPHFLSLSATPIPRSLALTIYGDLDISIINEMPKNRKPVITSIISNEKETYSFIAQEIKSGRQAFVVCPRIENNDNLELKSVKEEYKKLQNIFPQFNIDFIHGKMKGKEKEKIMNKMLNNEIQILVSTSVIEVGVNIPNATIMLIEGAERFGLAQLHQFRGRVNRSSHQAYCFLNVSNKESLNNKTKQRLQALQKYNDGFSIAKIDLSLRGSGDIYGLEQSGFPELKIASIFDYQLISQAQEEAKKIIQEDYTLNKFPTIKEKLSHWATNIHWE